MTPPRNVRLVDSHGKEHPVQTAFSHYDEGGLAVWEVVDRPPNIKVIAVRCDMIPQRTTVRLTMQDGDDLP